MDTFVCVSCPASEPLSRLPVASPVSISSASRRKAADTSSLQSEQCIALSPKPKAERQPTLDHELWCDSICDFDDGGDSEVHDDQDDQADDGADDDDCGGGDDVDDDDDYVWVLVSIFVP